MWAILDGTVVAVSYLSTGYGHSVDINHNQGYWARYAHLGAIYVHPGQHVNKGQSFALSDNTGNSSGPHLHFELKLNGAYVNPLNYLP